MLQQVCLITWASMAHAGSSPELGPEAIEETIQLIEEHWVGEVDREALYRAAVDGMLEHLDALGGASGNRALDPRQLVEYRAALEGVHSGIGVEFVIIPGQGLLVTEVFDGSPAHRAGVERGEAIVAVNGTPLQGLSAPAILSQARASDGARVVLDLVLADGKRRQAVVERGSYRTPPVRLLVGAPAPVVRVTALTEGAAAAVAAALQSHDAAVLDLRDDAVGTEGEAVALADVFLEPGTVIGTAESSQGARRTLVATRTAWTGRLVVLVNQGTAGPAELVVAALRDHQRATVVGTRTGGVGGARNLHEAECGLTLLLSDTAWRSPHGLAWDGMGLLPDYLVDASPPFMLSPLAAPPDLQLDAAFHLLENGMTPVSLPPR